MKRLFMVFVMLAVGVLLLPVAHAEEHGMMNKSGIVKEKGALEEVGNTVCPVSGGENKKGPASKVEY